MDLTLGEIAQVLNVHLSYGESTSVDGISVDSRSLQNGMLFFALQGERFNGHDFIDEVFKKGACAVVADQNQVSKSDREKKQIIFEVNDPLRALQDVASQYRQKFHFPVIAVTGTNGKTTTKEMISDVLSTHYSVLKNPGNFNNHIGVALSVCEWKKKGEVAVVEMGANHFGEIRRLCEIARPTHGVITNIGKAHLEFFHNIEGVLRVKAELLKFLGENGKAFLNGDDHYLSSLSNIVGKTITFGFSKGCDIKGDILITDESGFPCMKINGETVRFSVHGQYNLYNGLAAAAVGRMFDVSWKEIRRALESFHPVAKRMEVLEFSGIIVLNDCYNANPTSLEQALMTIQDMKKLKRRVAVLGDMLELGKHSREEHTKIGDRVAELGIDAFISYGNEMKNAADRARSLGMNMVLHFESKADIADYLKTWLMEGDGVLVKGSRGMQMEEVVKDLIR